MRTALAPAMLAAGISFMVACSSDASSAYYRQGRVTITGAPDGSGVTVTDFDDPNVIDTVSTDATGDYSVMRSGGDSTDLITATAPSTLEHTRSVNVGAKDTTVPTMTFTAAGGIRGVAALGDGARGSGNAGIIVQVGDVAAFTDDAGNYELPLVVAGPCHMRFLAAGYRETDVDGVVVPYDAIVTPREVVLAPN